MIKINLASKKTSTAWTARGQNPSASDAMDSGDFATIRSQAIKNLVIILIGPIGLFLYEQTLIPDLQAKVNALMNEQRVLTEKNTKASEAVTQTTKFRKEQEALQAQINSIESLKKERMREVKILDFIQKDIPEKMWLTKLELIEGKFQIEGLAVTDSELTQFMDVLSRSAYLKEVSLIRSSDSSSKNFGQVKKFEISCLMEKNL